MCISLQVWTTKFNFTVLNREYFKMYAEKLKIHGIYPEKLYICWHICRKNPSLWCQNNNSLRPKLNWRRFYAEPCTFFWWICDKSWIFSFQKQIVMCFTHENINLLVNLYQNSKLLTLKVQVNPFCWSNLYIFSTFESKLSIYSS